MKTTKKIILFTLFIVGILSFTEVEKNNTVLNLEEIDAISLLSKQEFGARPSSKFMFYVGTEIVEKARGYSLIKASIYICERTSDKYSLIATKNIISPYHKDTFLDYEIAKYNSNIELLKNGDKILNNNEKSTYSFNELIKYKTIYNRYLSSKNKLLKK